ncbi:hypothetical protein GCM10010300_46950 [Streptomyces olivaceoviridis]|nr:hypothetical protein GCM10010300_46950 [Streptomyces olivaceoviridis]
MAVTGSSAPALFMMPIAFTELRGLAGTAGLPTSPRNTVQRFPELASQATVVPLVVAVVRRDRPTCPPGRSVGAGSWGPPRPTRSTVTSGRRPWDGSHSVGRQPLAAG